MRRNFDEVTCAHAVCGCGNQPPYHCMYCCADLTDEELRTLAAENPDDPHSAFAKFREGGGDSNA